MDVVYNGQHSICFWKKTFDGAEYDIDDPMFTWDDFHLIPSSRPSISIPKANYSMAIIPNSNKRINITDYLLGGLTFDSRTGEWQFYIDHNQWPDWTSAHYDLEEYFNGSKMLVSLDDGTDGIYEGRVSLTAYDPGENYSTVTIGYDLDAKPITDFTGVLYRIRFIDSTGNILQNDRLAYNDIPYFRGSGSPIWSPAVDKAITNVDYHTTNL